MKLFFFHRPSKTVITLIAGNVLRWVIIIVLRFFSPIFIFKQTQEMGFSIKISVMWVLIFFGIMQFFKLVGVYYAENNSQKTSIKTQIMDSTYLFIPMFLTMLMTLYHHPLWLFGTAVFWGLGSGMFWQSWFTIMIKEGRIREFGEDLGAVNSFKALLTIITPVISGMIITYLGYGFLFAGCFILSLVTLYIFADLPNDRVHNDTTFQDMIQILRRNVTSALTYLGISISEFIHSTLFILFLFLMLGEELELGKFFSVVLLMAAIINPFMGDWIDRNGFKRVFRFGAPLLSLTWLGRSIINSLNVFIPNEVLYKLVFDPVDLGGMTLTLQKGREGRASGRATLFRETVYSGGSSLVSFILAGIIAIPSINLDTFFTGVFFCIAVLALLPAFYRD